MDGDTIKRAEAEFWRVLQDQLADETEIGAIGDPIRNTYGEQEVRRAIEAALDVAEKASRAAAFEDAAQRARYLAKHQNSPSWDEMSEYAKGFEVACEILDRTFREESRQGPRDGQVEGGVMEREV